MAFQQEAAMPLLDERVQKQVRSALSGVKHPVKLLMFTQGDGGALECDYCSETRNLVEEVGGLSDKIEVEIRDFQRDAELAARYGVDKIPAIVMLGGGENPKDHGIRFYGIPSGYEFSSFIEGLRTIGTGESGLSAHTLETIAGITRPVHIQVFVTPT
jgi:alkyl hydroperoxide reductase subunit AhpF